jgi:hypothetical protein
MRLRPAADIVRLGFAVALVFEALRFAHRAFCARLIFLRAAADIAGGAFDLDPPYAPTKAVSAAFSADNCFSTRSRSSLNFFTTPDRFVMIVPRLEIVSGVVR